MYQDNILNRSEMMQVVDEWWRTDTTLNLYRLITIACIAQIKKYENRSKQVNKESKK